MTASFDIRSSAFGTCSVYFGKKHGVTIRCGRHPDPRADHMLANPPFNDDKSSIHRIFLWPQN